MWAPVARESVPAGIAPTGPEKRGNRAEVSLEVKGEKHHFHLFSLLLFLVLPPPAAQFPAPARVKVSGSVSGSDR